MPDVDLDALAAKARDLRPWGRTARIDIDDLLALIERIRRAEAATPSRQALIEAIAEGMHRSLRETPYPGGPYGLTADVLLDLFATTRTNDAGSTDV